MSAGSVKHNCLIEFYWFLVVDLSSIGTNSREQDTNKTRHNTLEMLRIDYSQLKPCDVIWSASKANGHLVYPAEIINPTKGKASFESTRKCDSTLKSITITVMAALASMTRWSRSHNFCAVIMLLSPSLSASYRLTSNNFVQSRYASNLFTRVQRKYISPLEAIESTVESDAEPITHNYKRGQAITFAVLRFGPMGASVSPKSELLPALPKWWIDTDRLLPLRFSKLVFTHNWNHNVSLCE